MLASPSLGDNPLLAHALGQQSLSQSVVYLVSPGVGQVLALEVNLGTAAGTSQVLGEIQGCRSPGICVQQMFEPLLEFWANLGRLVGVIQLRNGSHERLGNKLPSKIPKPTSIIWKAAHRVFICH